VPLAFAGSNQLPKPGAKPRASAPNRFYMYGVIARLAMVAASYELEAHGPPADVARHNQEVKAAAEPTRVRREATAK
jgi:hypothetical protein